MTQKYKQRANLYHLCMMFLSQGVGFAFGVAYRNLLVWYDPNSSLISNELGLCLLLAVHSIAAFLAAKIIKLPLIWQLFSLLIAPAVIIYPSLGLPQGYLLLIVIISSLLYFPTLWTRVPYYPTSRKTYDKILSLLPKKEPVRFLDIGSGFGSLLFFLEKNLPHAEIEGVEISPLPYLVSKIRSLLTRSQVKISASNMWKTDLKQYDFIYAFLSPASMEKLWEKLKQEMKKDAVFISNSFPVPSKAQEEIAIDDRRKCVLYVYRNV